MKHAAKTLAHGLLLCLTFSGHLWAASSPIEQALGRIDQGRLAEARADLEAIVEGDGAASDRADALELLGDVAVWEDDLVGARDAWRRVVEEFPGTMAATYARTKLRLVAQILGAEAAPSPPAPAVAPSAAVEASPAVAATPAQVPPAAVEAPAPAPAETPRERVAAEPSAPAPAPPTDRAPEPMAAASAAERTARVLLAGDGDPPEAIEPVLELLRDRLASAGVAAETPPTTIWWRRKFEMAERDLLEAAGDAGVLWLDFRFGHRERVTLRCVDRNGQVLWQEKATGGMGFADHRPYDVYNGELVERLLSKVDERVGQACLPTGG